MLENDWITIENDVSGKANDFPGCPKAGTRFI
jgi:hypothetical protein